EIGADDDAALAAGGDVDVRIDAALADQPQARQPLDQRAGDRGPLPEEHQRLDVGEPPGQRLGLVDVVVPDGHVVPAELREARQGTERIEPVVENRDLHAPRSGRCSRRVATPRVDRRTTPDSSTTRPPSTASSQTGKRGQLVRHASMTSPYARGPA